MGTVNTLLAITDSKKWEHVAGSGNIWLLEEGRAIVGSGSNWYFEEVGRYRRRLTNVASRNSIDIFGRGNMWHEVGRYTQPRNWADIAENGQIWEEFEMTKYGGKWEMRGNTSEIGQDDWKWGKCSGL